MGKPLKVLLAAVASVVSLIVIAALTLPFFIDPNEFKPEIGSIVKEKTGRELEMPGELKLSFFPWLGLTTGKMILKNTQAFQDQAFVTVEESQVKVKLLPLLAKKIELSRIVLKGLELNLARNNQGIANWDDLTARDLEKTVAPAAPDGGRQQAKVPAKALALFAIGGLSVENARINWDDRQSGKRIEIKDLDLTTDKLAFDQPGAFSLAVVSYNPETGLTDSIKLTASLVVDKTLNTIVLANLGLQSTREGETVPRKSINSTLTATDIALDRAGQTVRISGLEAKSSGVSIAADITGEHIIDKPGYQGSFTVAQFNPANVLKQLGVKLPAMQDAAALSKLAMTFNLSATANSADINNLVINLDGTLIKGVAGIKGFSLPAVTFNLAVDAIDADRYLSPKVKNDRPVTTPAVALAAGLSAFPAETLRKFDANGDLSLGRLKINGLTLQDIKLKLQSKQGVISARQTVGRFYQGQYSGQLNLDMRGKQPALSVKEKVDQVQVGPLLKDFNGKERISGTANLSLGLQGQGSRLSQLKSTLNGGFSFFLKDAVLKGINLQKIIDRGKEFINGSALPTDNKDDQSIFSELKGTATVTNGLIQNQDLVAKSSKLRVDGKGSADLNSEMLDYKVTARLVKAEATGTEPEKLHSTPVVINIGGSFDKPNYKLNVESLLTDKNKAKIEKFLDKNKPKIDKLIDKLERIF